MAFGVYVHIPYCIQRCLYCDFATYEQSQIAPPAHYLDLVRSEILLRKNIFQPQTLDTLYFGGGTPSLVPAPIILSIIEALANSGYPTGPRSEVTIEINPATLSEEKISAYIRGGINRFSVGAQTFNDSLLKKLGREHNTQDTFDTLDLLRSRKLNYSFDLLFALPGQTLQDLNRDIDQVLQYLPPHISPYCLTIPEGHVLTPGRPIEDIQIEMFDLISARLKSAGYRQYEISNYALPGFESRHNSLYWNDDEYWGIGLGAHSYSKSSKWGDRFWNPNSFAAYESVINANTDIPETQREHLEAHQSLTDLCHISLRREEGIDLAKVERKFGHQTANKVQGVLLELCDRGLILSRGGAFSLTDQGKLVSNQVFSALTFLAGEI